MTAVQAVQGLLVVTILVGLAFRRRLGTCVSFTLYIATVLPNKLLLVFRPDLYTREVWLTTEILHAGCVLAIAVEISARVFQGPPRLRAIARVTVVTLLLAVLGAALRTPLDAELRTVTGQLLADVGTASAWLVGAVYALVLWYRLPIDALHGAILRGLVIYMVLMAGALFLLHQTSWSDALRIHASQVTATAYLAVLGVWTQAAWRPAERYSAEHARLLGWLQPRRRLESA